MKEQLAEMIRINRNHPSIIAWGMDNEVFFSARDTMPQVKKLLADEVRLTHELDPTRPASIDGAQRATSITSAILSATTAMARLCLQLLESRASLRSMGPP